MPSIPRLTEGARIAIVAPSGIFDPDRLAASCDLVTSWGFTPVEAPNLRARHRYTAGTAAERAADLRWALTAPDVDAVWFARGGYGTIHLLPLLPWNAIAPRPVIGFSDATALFCAMADRGLGHAVHGPVLHSLADHASARSQEHLRRLLTGERQTDEHPPLTHLAGPAAPIHGPLAGGNLCVLASLVGTPWLQNMRGCVLLLEDLHESPYKLDRLITQLRVSGALDGLTGVVLGEFLRCDPPPGADWTLRELLSDLLSPLGVPVYADAPIGHGATNHAIVLGAPASVSWRAGVPALEQP